MNDLRWSYILHNERGIEHDQPVIVLQHFRGNEEDVNEVSEEMATCRSAKVL